MTRRRKTHRSQEPGNPPRPEAAAAASRVAGAIPHVRWPGGRLAVCGLLLLAVAVIFGNTVGYDFVNFDDDVLISENPIVSRGITAQGVAGALTWNDSAMPHPLTLMSYMLDRQVFGLKPWGFHLENVLLHAATSVILFLILRRMTGELWASAFVALLFATHPLRAETVAWVSERKGVLSGLFFVATIAAYIAYVRRPSSPARYLAVAGWFTLTLLAKPQLVTLPFLLLLLDYWPLGRMGAARREKGGRDEGQADTPRRLPTSDLRPPTSGLRTPTPAPRTPLDLVVEKVPLFLLSVAGCVAAVLSQGDNIAPLEKLSIPARIANTLVSYAVYLGQFFWPVGLAAYYPRSEDQPAWQVGVAVLVLAALSAAALMLRRKQPAVLVGWLWYLGMFVPMIGLVQIGNHIRADRYTYLPHIGLGLAVVWGIRGAAERRGGDGRWRRRLYGVAGALLAAAWMACAWQQTSYWRNSERLWTRALECTSNNSLAHTDLGLALAGRGAFGAAIDQYQKALAIKPDNVQTLNDLGLALAACGRFDEAIDQYQKALAIKPDYIRAHTDLGIALVGRGRVDEAIDHFRTALAIQPDLVDAHFNLGLALAGRGQIDEAIDHYQQAVDLMPDYAEAHNNLGLALAGRGRIDEGIDHLRKAVEIQPDYAQAHNNLGGALAGRGRFDEGIDHLRTALAIQPDYVHAHVLLGEVMAQRGRVDEAREHYQAALGLAAARKDKALADAVRARIKLLAAAVPAGKTP